MTRFYSIVALLAVTSFLFTLTAQAEQPADVTSKVAWTDGFAPKVLSISTVFRSQYVGSNATLLYDRPVAQTDLFVKWPCGFSLDLWASVPTDPSDFGENYGTEFDITPGWSFQIYGLDVNTGVGLYDLHRTLTPESSDIIQPFIEISHDFNLAPNVTISPYGRLEANFTTNGDANGETFERLGTRMSWKINDLITLTGNTYILYDPGMCGNDVVWVGSAETSVLWDIGTGITLELPFIRVVGPFDSTKGNDDRGTEVIFGTGITFNF